MTFSRRNCRSSAAPSGRIQSAFPAAPLLVLALAVLPGCSSAPAILQTTYEVSGCGVDAVPGPLTLELMRAGYLHRSDRKGAYDVFHKPRIEKTPMLASEPYADRSGDFGLAACGQRKVFAAAELRSCERERDCTAEDQSEVGRALERLGCKVVSETRRARSWRLESRSDWTRDSCGQIVSELRIQK